MINFSVITPSQLNDLSNQVHGTFYADNTENLIHNLNELILEEVGLNRFDVSLSVRGLQENITVPTEIMFLHQEFRGRGFMTRYAAQEDGTGIFNVSWSNPEFTVFDKRSKKYWGHDLLPSLGLNAKAYEYYLILTGGEDMRAYSPDAFIADAQKALITNTLKGNKVFGYYGPNECFLRAKNNSTNETAVAVAISNLFEEAADHLREKGFGVIDLTIPWTISFT